MCVIIVDPKGKEIDFEIVRRAVEHNPDGWGMAAFAPDGSGNILVTKGFGYQGAKRAWKKTTGLKRVFHARIGTSGTKDLLNCHPFDATYTEGETVQKRVFFHNGTIDIPRINDKFCDSWHFAQYIQRFRTDQALLNAITSYANREHSRFILMGRTEMAERGKANYWEDAVWQFGTGWITRGDHIYSNASALADNVVRCQPTGAHGAAWDGESPYGWATRKQYKGGLLEDASVEVTSAEYVQGLFYDRTRKVYTNIKPADYGQFPGLAKPLATVPEVLENITKAREMRGLQAKAEQALKIEVRKGSDSLKEVGEEESLRRFLDIDLKRVMSQPWMQSHFGRPGHLAWSWPSLDTYDYTACAGYEDVFRVLGKDGVWREIQRKDGRHLGVVRVGGPYEGGLLMTCDSHDVIYDGEAISLEEWQGLVIETAFPWILDDADFMDQLEEAELAQEARALRENSTQHETIEITKDVNGNDTIVVTG